MVPCLIKAAEGNGDAGKDKLAALEKRGKVTGKASRARAVARGSNSHQPNQTAAQVGGILYCLADDDDGDNKFSDYKDYKNNNN